MPDAEIDVKPATSLTATEATPFSFEVCDVDAQGPEPEVS
eukprot:CAMPEP_0171656764 /NCGR_PEP_ID=MMETSP0990-20121206/41806_1 /TAXON_ID=483369 /ORGANISM="non described non described, Strain CCMP2098" /LENGTH=39 /DNA_ID= /DNA_START= /DNA_END= /DNA_ORIENTATION=